MSRLALPLLLLAACAGPSDDDADTDVVDTDEGSDTDVVDTDVAASCTPASLDEVDPRLTSPEAEEDVTFHRLIDLCASGDGLSGRWSVQVTDADDRQFCTFAVSFSSDEPDEGCDGCERAYAGVTYADATFSDVDGCALFGLDDDFVEGLAAFDRLAVDVDEADLLYFVEGTWESLDPTPETVHTAVEEGAAVHLTLDFETTYPF